MFDFDFNVTIDKKIDQGYHFVSEESYINVIMSNNEVVKIETEDGEGQKSIGIIEYGLDSEKFEFVSDIENFEEKEA